MTYHMLYIMYSILDFNIISSIIYQTLNLIYTYVLLRKLPPFFNFKYRLRYFENEYVNSDLLDDSKYNYDDDEFNNISDQKFNTLLNDWEDDSYANW